MTFIGIQDKAEEDRKVNRKTILDKEGCTDMSRVVLTN